MEVDSEWFGVHEARLKVTRFFEHQHADLVDFRHPSIRQSLRQAIEVPTTVACFVRGKGGGVPGVSATHLNAAIRASIRIGGGWGFEALHEDGIFFDTDDYEHVKTQGYDIAQYDRTANIRRLWNHCFGRVHLHKGEEFWKKTAGRPHWAKELEALQRGELKPGTDLLVEKRIPTSVGEIQFGNWALVNNDFKKFIKSSFESDVDLFVYVTATGTLQSLLSDGIVTYEKTCAELKSPFGKAITAPILVVGVDVDAIGKRIGPLPAEITTALRRYPGAILDWDMYQESGLNVNAPAPYQQSTAPTRAQVAAGEPR